MDEATGFCRGCLRTLDEIASWSDFGSGERARVLESIGQRKRQMAGAADPSNPL